MTAFKQPMGFEPRSIFMHLHTSILKTIAYFDLFSYPLTLEDIRRFLDVKAEEAAISEETEMLVREGRLYRLGAYYSLQDNSALALRRLRGEAHADDLLRIADRGARLLYQFPFVRGVCVSGSLSKRCADEKADIDYFIITSANRIWIARTLMHLFKKLTYLLGHQHRYCMNYYIDEDALEIREKNIFTAIELFTLLPMSGDEGLDKFFKANDWTSEYFPGYRDRSRKANETRPPSFIKRLFERILNNGFGNRLENKLRRITDQRWRQKTEQQRRNMKGDVLTLQCGKHYSRPNPEIFQQKVLAKYHSRLNDVFKRRDSHFISS
jgi:hypothetical protein